VPRDAEGFGDSVHSARDIVKKKNKIISPAIDSLKISPIAEVDGDFQLKFLLVDYRLNEALDHLGSHKGNLPGLSAFNGRQLFRQPAAKAVVFLELAGDESDGEPGLGLDSFWCEEISIADLVGALPEVAHLDETFAKKALEDVIDLPKADAGVLGELALVYDRLPVQGVEDFESFLA